MGKRGSPPALAAAAAAKRSTSKGRRWPGLPAVAVAFAAFAIGLAARLEWGPFSMDAGGAGPSARNIRLEEVAAHVDRLRRDEAAALPCVDGSPNCPSWASSGECRKNPDYMLVSCRASCGVCAHEAGSVASGAANTASANAGSGECQDKHSMCATWASIGECNTNPSFMHVQCPVTCRLCQSASCRDMRTDCAERAKHGGCYTTSGMRDDCAWTCVSCDTEDKPECMRDRGVPAAATKGGVERMFRRIVEAGEDLSVVGGRGTVKVHSESPWVISIDDFLTSNEADALLGAGGKGWTRSLAGDGEQEARTSSTAWCRAECIADPTVQAIQTRVEAVTGVPTENAEFMQVLRYEPGQFYKRHHDQNSPRSSAWGPRCYTFFMYLSDVVAGGATSFPELNITVEPKKGRALLWPSVLDDDPYERDDRTDHEALPVEQGTKFAANYWLHMYPFREKSLRGCDNAPYINNWY